MGYLHSFKAPLPKTLFFFNYKEESYFTVEKMDRQSLNQVTEGITARKGISCAS